MRGLKPGVVAKGLALLFALATVSYLGAAFVAHTGPFSEASSTGGTKTLPGGSRPTSPSKITTTATSTPPAVSSASAQALQIKLVDALKKGAAQASKLGGVGAAAVWVSGAATPGTTSAAITSKRIRMWSVSKPVAAVAVLQVAAELPEGASPALKAAIHDAITQSSNCAQRRVVLGLQAIAGTAAQSHAQHYAAAQEQFKSVLTSAGVKGTTTVDRQTDGECAAYLAASPVKGWPPSSDALLFGTTTWTLSDAVHWMAALQAGTYGRSGESVLGYMRLPKSKPPLSEAPPGSYTPSSLAWGAGDSLAAWHPAYKSGWGGHATNEFFVSQVVGVTVGKQRIAIAVQFRPSTNPPSDNPADSPAIQGIQTMLSSIRPVLVKAERG